MCSKSKTSSNPHKRIKFKFLSLKIVSTCMYQTNIILRPRFLYSLFTSIKAGRFAYPFKKAVSVQLLSLNRKERESALWYFVNIRVVIIGTQVSSLFPVAKECGKLITCDDWNPLFWLKPVFFLSSLFRQFNPHSFLFCFVTSSCGLWSFTWSNKWLVFWWIHIVSQQRSV